MVEVVRLTRAIGRIEPFAGMVESDIFSAQPVADAQLRDHILANVSTYAHPTSTVPMGRDGDPTAVVDGWGRVRGINGLHVVDASIFPDIPSVLTNVTTIMVAGRIAGRRRA